MSLSIQKVFVQLKRLSIDRERLISVRSLGEFLVHTTCYITRVIRSIASPLQGLMIVGAPGPRAHRPFGQDRSSSVGLAYQKNNCFEKLNRPR